MADEADKATEHESEFLDNAIKAAPGDIPPGVEGDCELCGEWFGRLVDGACVPCREKRGL